jgi:D-glycero-D-manno-heptose 1,7-bisphosphate phosphatase
MSFHPNQFMRTQPAIFLDRDGVLIEDVHLLTSCEQVKLFEYVPNALMQLKNAGFLLVVVTNQTVIARGLAAEYDVENVHEFIQKMLMQDVGCGIDRYYFCPHHPNATDERYRQICKCRKPRPGMILQAARELHLDIAKSWLIGDRISDIIAAQDAGCKSILVETGMHTAPAIEFAHPIVFSGTPDFTCANLSVAVDIILKECM